MMEDKDFILTKWKPFPKDRLAREIHDLQLQAENDAAELAVKTHDFPDGQWATVFGLEGTRIIDDVETEGFTPFLMILHSEDERETTTLCFRSL